MTTITELAAELNPTEQNERERERDWEDGRVVERVIELRMGEKGMIWEGLGEEEKGWKDKKMGEGLERGGWVRG